MTKAVPHTILLVLALMYFACHQTDIRRSSKGVLVNVSVTAEYFKLPIPKSTNPGHIKLQYCPLNYIGSVAPVQSIEHPVNNGQATWFLPSTQPIFIWLPYAATILVNPGDSLFIDYKAGKPVFTGCSDDRCDLINKLVDARSSRLFKRNLNKPIDLDEYLDWNRYVDTMLSRQLQIVDSYKGKIPGAEYDFYISEAISVLENERVSAFSSLLDSVQLGYQGVSLKDLDIIWDSTQYKSGRKFLRSLPKFTGSINSLYAFNRMEVWRQFDFNFSNDSLSSKDLRTVCYYVNAKKNYRDLSKERLLVFILDESVLKEMGPENKFAKAMLNDYYSHSEYPQFKNFVKDLEKKAVVTWAGKKTEL